METIAPGLSAARLRQTLTPQGGGRGFGCVVKMPLVSSHPLLGRGAHLRGPWPWNSLSTAEGATGPIKGPPKGSPDHEATDPVLQGTVSNLLSSGSAWTFPPGPKCVLSHCSLYFLMWCSGRGPSPTEQMEGSNQMALGPLDGWSAST